MPSGDEVTERLLHANVAMGKVRSVFDPLIEFPEQNLPREKRVQRYVALGRHWSSGRANRMIKVPALPYRPAASGV